ncbi:MAG: hypothetical protein JWL83_1851 [Actinomycetia bacterium]|nr:hypothetical protein [Actinomycetes bacterium]
MQPSELSGISPDEFQAEYDRRGVATWSRQRLVAAATRTIAVPRRAAADSFVLHAPLELLARAALLRFVAPAAEDAGRRRLVWLAASYDAAGAPVDELAPGAPPTLEAAAATLVAAITDGDLDAVDRYATFIGGNATPRDVHRLLAGAVAPSLAAAGHAPILFNLLPHGDGQSTLLRGPARELACHPDWQLHWFDDATETAEAAAPTSLLDALLDVPMLGLPGSDFIYPVMSQVQDSGLAAKLLAGPLGAQTDPRQAGREILRVAAWSMLQEPPDHAPYGWTHCLTMPQAVLGCAGTGFPVRVALAIAATHVAGFRAALGQRHLVADAVPSATPETDWRSALDAEPAVAAASVWHAAPSEVDAIVTELAGRASAHYDAHLVKYTLACLDARNTDPQYERTYLAAAASLTAWWQASSLVAAAAGGGVDGDGDEKHDRGDDELRRGVETLQAHAVVDRGDHDAAEHRVDRLASSTEEARSADDRGRNRVQHEVAAIEVRRHGPQP